MDNMQRGISAGDNFSRLRILLASGSQARAQLLRQAGVCFDLCRVPNAVEETEKERFRRDDKYLGKPVDARAMALSLARVKAEWAARHYPDHLVVGADQTLELEGDVLHKAGNHREAAIQLCRLQGRRHRLHSAYICIKGTKKLAMGDDFADLTMHAMDEDACQRYLDHLGDAVLESVGLYRLEAEGIRLFRDISGDYFTILGLPLISLLNTFRDLMRAEDRA